MGTNKQTTTTSASLPGQSAQEQEARQLLMELASSGAGQLGDLSAIASGQLSLDPSFLGLLEQINAASAEMARREAERDFETMAGGVASQGLARGIDTSSIDAVNQAVLGRELQHTLGQQGLQRQAQTSQQAYQGAFDTANMRMNVNQLLLQQILNSASPLAQLSLDERLAQRTTTETVEQPFDVTQAAALGVRAAEMV